MDEIIQTSYNVKWLNPPTNESTSWVMDENEVIPRILIDEFERARTRRSLRGKKTMKINGKDVEKLIGKREQTLYKVKWQDTWETKEKIPEQLVAKWQLEQRKEKAKRSADISSQSSTKKKKVAVKEATSCESGNEEPNGVSDAAGVQQKDPKVNKERS